MDKTQFVKIEVNRTKHIYMYTYQHNYRSVHVYIQVRCRLMEDKHAYTRYPLSRKNDYTFRFFNNKKWGPFGKKWGRFDLLPLQVTDKLYHIMIMLYTSP